MPRAPSLLLLLVLLVPAPLRADDHIGARRCKTCHLAQFEQWRGTPHARAFERLSAAEQQDPRCTACHATAASEGHVGVQCESCHGAGRYYWPEPVMRDPELARQVGLARGDEEKVCRRCHTADQPSLLPFDFAKALPLVRHGAAQPGKGR